MEYKPIQNSIQVFTQNTTQAAYNTEAVSGIRRSSRFFKERSKIWPYIQKNSVYFYYILTETCTGVF